MISCLTLYIKIIVHGVMTKGLIIIRLLLFIGRSIVHKTFRFHSLKVPVFTNFMLPNKTAACT